MKYRKNHRQIINNDDIENKLDNVYTAQLDENDIEYFTEERGLDKKYADQSKYILKVKCTKETQFDYQTCTEYAKVEKIFKGDDELKIGDDIVIDNGTYHLFTKESGVVEGMDAVNNGFTNYMKPDNEYLIFVVDKVESKLYDYDVYRIDGWTIAPIFNYKDLPNVMISGNSSIQYKDVKDNEIFVNSEECEKAYYEFKKRIISTYDEEYAN